MKNIRLSGTTKRILIIAAVIAIIGAGWLWMQRGSRDGDALNLYGNVDIRQVRLGFRVGGRLAEALVAVHRERHRKDVRQVEDQQSRQRDAQHLSRIAVFV